MVKKFRSDSCLTKIYENGKQGRGHPDITETS